MKSRLLCSLLLVMTFATALAEPILVSDFKGIKYKISGLKANKNGRGYYLTIDSHGGTISMGMPVSVVPERIDWRTAPDDVAKLGSIEDRLEDLMEAGKLRTIAGKYCYISGQRLHVVSLFLIYTGSNHALSIRSSEESEEVFDMPPKWLLEYWGKKGQGSNTSSQTNSGEHSNGKASPSGKGESPNNRRSAPRQPPENPPPAKPGSAPR